MHRPKTNPHSFQGIVTTAPEMDKLFELIRRVARTETSVLIRGETGTGKELVARAIHDLSPRAARSFQAINCATLTPELLASRLFGHVKGAFTGAVRDRRGLFQLADGGTLFLDEIAEIPLDIQARLLRVLEERTFVPVGGSEPISVDVRFVSATHHSLRRLSEEGRFREDLMYRIRVGVLFLPSLRERSGDVEALTWHFIEQFNHQGYRSVTKIAPDAVRALCSYPWPGNIRELRNAIEYSFAFGEHDTITLDELPPELRGEAPPEDRIDKSRPKTLSDIERDRILSALQQAGGKKGRAAEILDMSRSTLWRKMREYRLVN